MKAHTTQMIATALGLLFTAAVMAQGNRDWDDRGRPDSRNRDYHDRGRNDDNNRYRHSRDARDCYEYPVSRYKPHPHHVENRGRRPSPYHVWLPGEYRWRNGAYVYHGGNWMVPPRRGMQYVPGYWQPARGGGYIWISGFWSGGGVSIRF